MGKRDRRVDAYIAKSADFAKPILRHLREVVHEGCPDADEAIKWGMPFFVASVADLPPRRTLLGYVRKAAALNDPNAKPASRPPSSGSRKTSRRPGGTRRSGALRRA
jgi:hypothetical protein